MDTFTDFSLPETHVPSWVNRTLTLGLKTPGLQSLLGRQLGLITFTGRRSQRRMTTPVSYYRDGDTVLISPGKRETGGATSGPNPTSRCG